MMKRKYEKILLCCSLFFVMCFILGKVVQADTQRAKQAYIIDYNKENNQTNIPQVGSSNLHVWMFPGDTLTIIPPSNMIPGDEVHSNEYTVGIQIENEEDLVGNLSLSKKEYGSQTKEDVSNKVITNLTVTGTKPIFITLNSSYTCGEDKSKHNIYRVNGAFVSVADATIPIEYSYVDRDGNQINPSQVYYYEDEMPTEVKAYDCTSSTNLTSIGTGKTVNLASPIIEGYYFSSWTYEGCVNAKNESNYKFVLDSTYNSGRHYYFNWYLNDTMSRDMVYNYGQGAVAKFKATYYQGPTLTLNACGGTINGIEKKVFQADHLYDFTFSKIDLSQKNPIRAGYTFDGWYTDTNYSKKVENLATWYNETKDDTYIKSLYAKWKSSSDSTQDSGSGEGNSGSNNTPITNNTPSTESPVVTIAAAKIKALTPGAKKLVVTATTKPSALNGNSFQIYYKLKGSKKWKSTTTNSNKVTIKKLKKGKQYYVKIRAYAKVNGTTVYGAWSATKLSKKIK